MWTKLITLCHAPEKSNDIDKFDVIGLNDHVSGHWITANSSVVSVDMPSGIAEAVGDGTTQGNL